MELEKLKELNEKITVMASTLDATTEQLAADPGESVLVLTDESFRAMLRNISPETLREAHKAVVFFDEQLENEEGKKLTDNAKGLFIASLLIEYGKNGRGRNV